MGFTLLRFHLLLLLILSQSACSTISYYGQSIRGHMQVMSNSQAIDKVLKDDDVNDTNKKKLSNVLQLLEFAETELMLPNNGSYREYADIGRPYVVWNVFATGPFSFKPVESCFFFVGCLGYRGFYAKADAEEYAHELKAHSQDVFLGGVAAYSTLGWFKDPVLNTMLRWDQIYLNKVILHELAHQKFYLKGDSAFNEAFADTVALIGLKRWLSRQENEIELQQYLLEQQYEDEFVDLVLSYKNKLEILYETNLPESLKSRRKQQLFVQLEKDYQTLKQGWAGYNDFDNWFVPPPNNAKISAISTYREFIPGFLSLFQLAEQDIEQFYELVIGLSECPLSERHQILKKQMQNWSC